jgi:hypothetical protein
MILKAKLFCLFASICILSTTLSAQSLKHTIKGTINDTLNRTALENAVVYIKNSKDSSLISYARADKKGDFQFHNIQEGNYVMVVTYPQYVDWIDTIHLTTEPKEPINISLTTKAHLLQEVIVKQTIAPIRIKGDTTEYLADSFHVKAGATVEDLLKIMPGISVNSKGEITTQGQKVQKVLVDGDEFFGDDPTMATQNLNARDVVKVQVFDKKSDQSTLTGIDDGTKQKTVNLILKNDAKKGYFGNATAGTSFNKYYQSKLTASRFTSTLKAGILVTADKTGRNGMNWDEMQDFGSFSDGSDEFSSYGQQGLPENLQTAVMLNKKFGLMKNSTANNFSYNHLNLAGEGTTNTKYILPDSIYYSNQSTENKSSKWKENFSTKNEWNIDSLTTLTVNARIAQGKSSSTNVLTGEYLTDKQIPVNRNNRTNSSNGDNNSNKADIYLRRKLNKAGTRSFSLSTGLTNNISNSDGYLLNQTQFYTGGIPTTLQTIDQRKLSANNSQIIQALASYVEPLSKKLSLNINYTFNSNHSEQDTRSYEKENGKYDSLNLLYSNHYKYTNASNRFGFSFNYTTKIVNVRAGLAIQDLALKQTNIYKDSSYARSFTNYFPTAQIRWKLSSSGSANLAYSGFSQQPSLMNLQPILNNNDPLNQVIGNPNLQPAFNHNFNFNLSDFKVLSNRSIWGYGNFTIMENAFSNRSVLDNQGRRISQTVNVNGNYNYNLGFMFSKQIHFQKLQIGFNPNINGGQSKNFLNGNENITQRIYISPGFSLRKSIEKIMSTEISYAVGFNHSTSSINSGAVTEYWTQTINVSFDYKFKNGLSFNSNMDYNYRQKLSPTDRNNNALIWNASVEKTLIKKSGLTAIVTLNDILNQRIGFNRDLSSNYITESTYTTIQRYALFSLRWKFNKNRKTSEEN